MNRKKKKNSRALSNVYYNNRYFIYIIKNNRTIPNYFYDRINKLSVGVVDKVLSSIYDSFSI